ncbi:MAG TPA: competence/damage-inducible protein A, partial [Gaiellales bacterium]|nr:competence/damage-inducible protein A [Gaiellales bacterium]
MTRPTAAILLTGSELLRGVISDRNAAYLAERLEALGFSMHRTLMVGDPLADIEGGFRELAGGHDLIVTSGGLGPTHDDRTVEALAAVAGVPLELDEAVLARISTWTDEVAQRMGFDRARFDAGNRKQARIPRGAKVLGMAGTAPGLVMEVDGSVVVVLPGVPSELRRLWQLAPEHPLLAPL